SSATWPPNEWPTTCQGGIRFVCRAISAAMPAWGRVPTTDGAAAAPSSSGMTPSHISGVSRVPCNSSQGTCRPYPQARLAHSLPWQRNALVLAGGGLAGIAWETGILLGIADEAPRTAKALLDVDVMVGTSAGSTVAA